jgi:hypothetical protein
MTLLTSSSSFWPPRFVHLSANTSLPGRTMRISHVHPRCSGYMPCSPTPEVSSPPAHERWRGWCLRAFRHPRPPHKSVLTGLNRFSLTAYGLHPPCLRLTHAVTGVSPRLGMECVGSTLFQSHLQRQAAVRFVAHRKYTLRRYSFVFKEIEAKSASFPHRADVIPASSPERCS